MLANIFLGNLWRKFILKKALVTRYHKNNGKSTSTGECIPNVFINDLGINSQGNGDVHSKLDKRKATRRVAKSQDLRYNGELYNSHSIPCYRCGKSLDIGAQVWSHPNGCKTKYYCPGCYDKLWL